MGLAGFQSFNREVVEKYSEGAELNGTSLRPESALALLVELARSEARPDRACNRPSGAVILNDGIHRGGRFAASFFVVAIFRI